MHSATRSRFVRMQVLYFTRPATLPHPPRSGLLLARLVTFRWVPRSRRVAHRSSGNVSHYSLLAVAFTRSIARTQLRRTASEYSHRHPGPASQTQQVRNYTTSINRPMSCGYSRKLPGFLLSRRVVWLPACRGCSCACLPLFAWVVHFARLGCSPARTQRRPASVQLHPGTIPPAVPLQVSDFRPPLAISARPPRLGCGCPVWIVPPGLRTPRANWTI